MLLSYSCFVKVPCGISLSVKETLAYNISQSFDHQKIKRSLLLTCLLLWLLIKLVEIPALFWHWMRVSLTRTLQFQPERITELCLILDEWYLMEISCKYNFIHTATLYSKKDLLLLSSFWMVVSICLATSKTHTIQFGKKNIFFQHLGLFLCETTRFSLFKSILKQQSKTSTQDTCQRICTA